MAWKNGQWVPEDDSVAPRVAEITRSDSPLMQQAAGLGMKQANRRGLGNSSIAVGAAQNAVISAATPIASQEAAQIASKNQQAMTQDFTREENAKQLAANERARLADSIGNASNNYSAAVSNMAANPKMKAVDRSRFLSSQQNVLNAQIGLYERLYGTNLNWGTGPSAPTAGA